MEQNLQAIILKNLIQNEIFCRKALPHIKPEYFEGHNKAVYELILKFIGKYNKLPNGAVLDIEFQSSDYVTTSDRMNIAESIRNIDVPEPVELEWLVDSTEKWCKDRAVYLAIMESISIIDGKSGENGEGMIPDILSKALSVTFDTNVGHDYLENADGRFDFYHKKEDKIAFDLDMFNVITGGGIPRKTLNIILAGCVHPDTLITIRYRKKVA